MQKIQWQREWTVEKLKEMAISGELDQAIIENLPIEIYHHKEAPGISSSQIVGIKKSLLHLETEREKSSSSPALAFGNFVHTAVLEPELLHETYTQRPDEPKFDKRTKEGKAGHAKWLEETFIPWDNVHGHKHAFSGEDWERCRQMKENIMEHSEFNEFFQAALKETSFFSKCPKTGMLQKCRTDLFVPTIFVAIDLKTTADASNVGFGKSCINYDYIIKQAFYDMILRRFFNKEISYLLMAAENIAPFDCQLFEISQADLEVGHEYVKNFVEKYRNESSGITRKGYPRGVQPLRLPAYFYNADKYDIN